MLILADHSLWHTWGEATIWTAGVLTALGVISRTRPARWLWGQLVGKPVTEWSEKVVGGVVDAKVSQNNGGSSLRDRVDALNDGQEALTASVSADRLDIKQALENIHSCLDTRFADTHQRMEKLTEYAEEVLVEAIGAKERIRQLYRALETPVFETNAQGWCTYINPAYSKVTGLSVEEALGEGWAASLHPNDRDRVFKTWAVAVEESAEFTAIYRFRNVVTGREVEVRGSAAPLHDAHRNVVGWVGTIDPITPSASLGVIETAGAVEDS